MFYCNALIGMLCLLWQKDLSAAFKKILFRRKCEILHQLQRSGIISNRYALDVDRHICASSNGKDSFAETDLDANELVFPCRSLAENI